MKFEFNKRTMQMEPVKNIGIEVSARMGGVMVEDKSRHIQFMINYGNGVISHCVCCKADNIRIFTDNDARKIADSVKQIGYNKGIPTSYFDWKQYSINCRNIQN